MKEKELIINLKQDTEVELRFSLESTPITELWLERMRNRHQWPLDNPDRFYGFNNYDDEVAWATEMILHNVNVINNYQPLITKDCTSVYDQDLLNYLHNIFEKYHGQLGS